MKISRQHTLIQLHIYVNVFPQKINKQELIVRYSKTLPSFHIQLNSFHNFVSELTKLT